VEVHQRDQVWGATAGVKKKGGGDVLIWQFIKGVFHFGGGTWGQSRSWGGKKPVERKEFSSVPLEKLSQGKTMRESVELKSPDQLTKAHGGGEKKHPGLFHGVNW